MFSHRRKAGRKKAEVALDSAVLLLGPIFIYL
jgi:hypothetical protein